MNLTVINSKKTASGKVIHTNRFTVKKPQHQNDRLLALALETTNEGIWVWYIPTGEAYFSPRFYAFLGYETDELPANYASWAGLLHPDDLETTQKIIENHIDNRSEGYEAEFRLQTKSGDWRWVLGRGKVVEWDEDGQSICMVGSHVDIDMRKRAERNLAEYKEQLENMVKERTAALEHTTSLLEATFNAIPDVLGVQDNRHHILRYNAAGYRFLNMTHAEVAGKKCFELIGRKKQCEPCATSESYRTKKPVSLERYEKTLDVWFDVRAYPILDEKGNIVQVIEHLRDITPAKTSELENRRLNEQLLQAQKMESLGTLAGGIAHDFNNLLMGIQGHVSLMALSMDPDSHQLEHIKAIDEYIQSATDLTKRLLSLARIEKYEVRVIDMNELLRNSAAMFGRTRKELQIHTKTIPGPLTVAVDKRQIEQVLLNIYINAWQAMRDGGELYLETKIVNLDKAYCKPYKVRAGRYAKVSVTDTGIGMNKATLKRIFDPFFTTKKKGGGTGLGLASAYGIIKNHSGFITVYSKVGQGSTFDVYLPVSDKELLQSVHTRSGLVKGSGTVLLVDDEEMIIDVCGAMLENMGYLVIAARNGAQAVDAVRQKKHVIDLVILDLIMPGMNGGQTFDLIRDIQPNMPVILASGYAFDGLTTKAMKKGCNGFIQKPFNFSDLSQKIRKILNGTKGLAQIK